LNISTQGLSANESITEHLMRQLSAIQPPAEPKNRKEIKRKKIDAAGKKIIIMRVLEHNKNKNYLIYMIAQLRDEKRSK
jgi:hypothetical protein